jgi:hypothetical protein
VVGEKPFFWAVGQSHLRNRAALDIGHLSPFSHLQFRATLRNLQHQRERSPALLCALDN